MKIQTLALVCSLLLPTARGEDFILNEQSIPALSQGPLPRMDEIQTAYLQAELDEKSRLSNLGWEGFMGGAYSENRARPLINFQPIWSPVRTAELGVRKASKYGASTQLGVITEQVTGKTPVFGVKNGTTTVARLGIGVDLWRDLFGRSTKADLEQLALGRERAALEKQVNEKAFNLTLRRLYWSLVANEYSTRISQGLLEQSSEQARQAKKRSDNYVADSSEVARYEAQVSSRRSALVALNYQREALRKNLVVLVPSLAGKDLKLDEVDIDSTVAEVLACTQVIAARQSTPYDYTRYDEMIDLLRRQKMAKLNSVDRSGGPDVQLTGDYQFTGVDQGATRAGSIGGSVRDIEQSNREGFSVGLKATIPLDDSRKSVEETRERLETRRFDAQLSGTQAQVEATHLQLQNNVTLLVDIIKYQKESSSLLKKRLSAERQKYAQARIAVEDLINNQDALLTSELGVVDAQLQMLNSLFDYLLVFSETPCAFNQKI